MVPSSICFCVFYYLWTFNAKIFLEKNPKIAAEIEMAIRTKAGLISRKIEGNPAVEKTSTDRKNPNN